MNLRVYVLLFTLALSVLCVKNSEYGIAFVKRKGKANPVSRKSEVNLNEDLSLLQRSFNRQTRDVQRCYNVCYKGRGTCEKVCENV